MKRKIIIGISGFVILIIGILIGSSGNSHTVTRTNTVASPVPGPTITETDTVTASPPPPGNGKTLMSKQGSNQNWNSTPFNVGDGPITVSYTYSACPDGSGNFILDLITTAGQSDPSYEDINIANIIGSGASDKTREYPQNPGGEYYLSVQTECTYSVKVVNG